MIFKTMAKGANGWDGEMWTKTEHVRSVLPPSKGMTGMNRPPCRSRLRLTKTCSRSCFPEGLGGKCAHSHLFTPSHLWSTCFVNLGSLTFLHRRLLFNKIESKTPPESIFMRIKWDDFYNEPNFCHIRPPSSQVVSSFVSEWSTFSRWWSMSSQGTVSCKTGLRTDKIFNASFVSTMPWMAEVIRLDCCYSK